MLSTWSHPCHFEYAPCRAKKWSEARADTACKIIGLLLTTEVARELAGCEPGLMDVLQEIQQELSITFLTAGQV